MSNSSLFNTCIAFLQPSGLIFFGKFQENFWCFVVLNHGALWLLRPTGWGGSDRQVRSSVALALSWCFPLPRCLGQHHQRNLPRHTSSTVGEHSGVQLGQRSPGMDVLIAMRCVPSHLRLYEPWGLLLPTPGLVLGMIARWEALNNGLPVSTSVHYILWYGYIWWVY